MNFRAFLEDFFCIIINFGPSFFLGLGFFALARTGVLYSTFWTEWMFYQRKYIHVRRFSSLVDLLILCLQHNVL